MQKLKFYLLACFVVALLLSILPTWMLTDPGMISGLIQVMGYLGMVVSGLILVIIIFKEKNTQTVIQKAFSNDPFWETDSMKLHARNVFYNVQRSWEQGNVELITDLLTPGLLNSFRENLSINQQSNLKEIISAIDILETRLICCHDLPDKDCDKFVAYFNGTLIQSQQHVVTNEVISNRQREKLEFSETYHFVRQENKWLLNDIDAKISLWDLITLRNIYQVD